MESIRAQFPVADLMVGKRPLIYLDNAATSQKPRCVLDAITRYYEQSNANIHRGAHYLSRLATEAHEQARQTVARFLGATSADELIFTSGCTEGINLVAQILDARIQEGDEILVTTDAHHSNIVPWQMLAQRRGASVRPIPLLDDLQLDWDIFQSMLSDKTVVLAFPASSNSTGMQHPIKMMIAAAKAANPDCICLLDGAQSTGHAEIDVSELGCDFYAFSGHKVYAPTGTGALWGRRALLEQLPPWKGGGEMIKEVRFEGTSYNELPFKYEAGTPNICGNIVLAEAIRFVESIGVDKIAAHEHALMQALCAGLSELDGIKLLGNDNNRGALVSVLVEGVHHYDLAMLLDQMGVAVRSGHHCCQPLMHHLGVTGTTRFSVATYNSMAEMEAAVAATKRALNMLR
ncbi:MAG: cysteine desulfurase [Akkermansia sp.]